MVYCKQARLDVAFTALDAARHHRSAGPRESELAVSPLAAPFTVSLPAVVKHLGVLATAGMIEREKTGGTAHCPASRRPMQLSYFAVTLRALLSPTARLPCRLRRGGARLQAKAHAQPPSQIAHGISLSGVAGPGNNSAVLRTDLRA